MQQNTALAMLGSTNDYCMFDFATYAKCKRILQVKDAEIARLYGNIIRDKEASADWLDVGSSDGSLLNRIFDQLIGQTPIVVDCVDPDRFGLTRLRQRQGKFDQRGIRLNIFQERIQDFLKYTRRRYELILCTHLFYHIPKEQWPSIISGLSALLKTNGCLLICLVSYESDIYRVWDGIANTLSGLPRRFDDAGDLIFAEDMRAVLKQEGVELRSYKIEATFRFSGSDREEYIDRSLQRLAETSFITQFFAYMLRLYPKDLSQVCCARDIMKLSRHGDLAFQSIDYVFEIRTAAS